MLCIADIAAPLTFSAAHNKSYWHYSMTYEKMPYPFCQDSLYQMHWIAAGEGTRPIRS